MKALTIAVYADDYLLLLEFISSIEKELPTATLKVYGSEDLLSSMPPESMDYFAEDIDTLANSDILMLLAKLPDESASLLDKYEGTALSIVDDYDNSDVIYIRDPLLALLDEIVEANDGCRIILGLPLAIYGRPGIDALMQETRAIYTFDTIEGEDALLPMPVAFNIHFYQNLPAVSEKKAKWEKQLAELRKKAVVSLRVNPVSTVYIVDIFSDDSLELPESETQEFYEPQEAFSLEDVNNDHRIAQLASDDGRLNSFIGDYFHMFTRNLISAVKSAAS
jgi:hypothetical protein